MNNNLKISKKAKISNIELKKVIRNQLDIKRRQITELDMKDLDKLYINDYKITELTGLEYATNLKQLIIYSNSITDFSVLAKLTNLRTLNINLCTKFDINIISELTKLSELNLTWSNIDKFMTPCKNKTKISYTTLLNRVFEASKFTNRQRTVIEKYLFDPSKDTAREVIGITPRASMFVNEDLSEDDKDKAIKEEIQNKKVYIRYLQELLKMPNYKDKAEDYITNYGSAKARKFYMERIINKEKPIRYKYSKRGYDWYKSKRYQGYIF